jgi:hypothetical protein
MVARNIPIDGVGFQTHLTMDNPPSYQDYKSNMERFTALGLEVHVTELDVNLPTTFPNLPSAAQLEQQKQIYKTILKACLDTPGCKSVTAWGVDDGTSWLNSYTNSYQHPLMFDRSFAKKPAYFGVREELMNITPTFTPVPPTATSTPATSAVRIDSGATQNYTDTFGNLWLADTNFVGGATTNRNITVVTNDDPVIYKTERYNMTDYNVPVVNGNYAVRLHFAETYDGVTGSGQRIFDVNVEGSLLNNLDIWGETGGLNIGIVKIFNVTVSDGVLNIRFTSEVQSPNIQGIEILPSAGIVPTSTNRPTLTPMPTNTPPTSGGNLLTNPGFENGAVSWFCIGPCSTIHVTNPVHTGTGAGLVTNRSNNWNGAGQNVFATAQMPNGGTYNSSAWVRTVSGSASFQTIVKITDDTGEVFIPFGTPQPVNSSGWTQITATQPLNWTGTLSAVQWYVQSNEPGAPFVEFYVDDVNLNLVSTGATSTPTNTPPPQTNLLIDGGMELGLTHWYCFACTPVAVSTPVHSGSGAIQLTNRTANWNGVAQNFNSVAAFVNGGTYNTSFWARTASGTTNAQVFIKLTDSTGDVYLPLGAGTSINSSGWTQITGTGTLSWTGTLTGAVWYFGTTESAAPFTDIYVDDAFFAVQSSGTNTPTPTITNTPSGASNFLIDGGMELGLTHWYCFACTPVAVSTPVHTGSGAIQLTNRTANWNGVAQNFNSVAAFVNGATYTTSFWARTASGTTGARVNIKLTDSTGDVYVSIGNHITINSSGWTQITGTGTLSWTGTLTGAVWYFDTSESAAPFVDLYVDDAYFGIVPVATNTPTPTPTPTSTVSPTYTATNTATATPSVTNTPVPPRPDTIGAYNGGMWYLRNTNTTGVADITVAFGGDVSDLPVVGDWNGDGVDTIGVYRNSTGFFFLSDSNTAPTVSYTVLFGNPGDQPFAGRWDNTMSGSGVGVYRNSNGILYQKKTLTTGFEDFFAIFGDPGDQPVAGDWNADGFDSIGIYRASSQTWFMTNNSTPSGIVFSDIDFVWDIGTTRPVVGDWDADLDVTVGYLTDTGVFVLHPNNAATGTDNVFAFGPANSRPIAGKWVAASAPPISGVIGNGSTGGFSNAGEGGDAD